MGFSNSNATTTAVLTAKLTPLGRKLLVTNTNSLITKFSLGDSDADYNIDVTLTSGNVPSMGGNLGVGGSSSNSTSDESTIKYPVYLNSLGDIYQQVDPASINVTESKTKIGQNIAYGSATTSPVQALIDNTDVNQMLGSLYLSFGLPYNETLISDYTGTTFANGGWSDTAISGFGRTTALVISVPNSLYGENLDGREIKLDLFTTAATYTMYSTYQNKNLALTTEDINYRDISTTLSHLGSSISFLMSDDIVRPNGGDVTKSWATGFGDVKPYSIGNKELFNLKTDTNLLQTGDTVVGVAYLDKGMLVITDPTIIDNYVSGFSGNTGTTITFNSLATNVIQNITCLANRGEFGTSSNPTWSVGDTVRISEIGLYDDSDRLIAYGKFDRQILKTIDGISAFGIKITV